MKAAVGLVDWTNKVLSPLGRDVGLVDMVSVVPDGLSLVEPVGVSVPFGPPPIGNETVGLTVGIEPSWIEGRPVLLGLVEGVGGSLPSTEGVDGVPFEFKPSDAEGGVDGVSVGVAPDNT
mgnify:CR=1 FL=1